MAWTICKQTQRRPIQLNISPAQPDAKLPDGSCHKARLADAALSVSEIDYFVMINMYSKLHYALDVGDQWRSLEINGECKYEEQRPRPLQWKEKMQVNIHHHLQGISHAHQPICQADDEVVPPKWFHLAFQAVGPGNGVLLPSDAHPCAQWLQPQSGGDNIGAHPAEPLAGTAGDEWLQVESCITRCPNIWHRLVSLHDPSAIILVAQLHQRSSVWKC
jgi:hypothetical protein